MNELGDFHSLLASGQTKEAEAQSERWLESHPDDVAALKIAAYGALRQGMPLRAKIFLERAGASAPNDAEVKHQLARTLQLIGDHEGAFAADKSTLESAPDHTHARLYYALALERTDPERALLHFMRALKTAQAQGEWTDSSTTPISLRTHVEHAVRVVRHGQLALFEKLLNPLKSRYGFRALARIEAAIRIYVGEQSAHHPDSRQQPTFFYIPGLPQSPYLDRRLFPWIPEYESRFESIKDELQTLLASDLGSERVFGSVELERENLRGADLPPGWTGYYFYRYGQRRDDNCSACPHTAKALDALPLVAIREHGPEVLHSVLTAGTHLLPHRGMTNARCVTHLPLIVPENCALTVGGEERPWREGRTVVFDDTFEHEAWNRSSLTRVVLIADIWNPHLTDAERAAVTDTVTAMGDLRAAVETA